MELDVILVIDWMVINEAVKHTAFRRCCANLLLLGIRKLSLERSHW